MFLIVIEGSGRNHRVELVGSVWWGGENLPSALLAHMTDHHQGHCTAVWKDEQRRYTWSKE
jgi:hypothetical protein